MVGWMRGDEFSGGGCRWVVGWLVNGSTTTETKPTGVVVRSDPQNKKPHGDETNRPNKSSSHTDPHQTPQNNKQIRRTGRPPVLVHHDGHVHPPLSHLLLFVLRFVCACVRNRVCALAAGGACRCDLLWGYVRATSCVLG